MTYADRLNKWNRWYDSTPEEWHAHILLWPLALVGFLNMQLTITSGFPFGLLVLIALVAIAAVRLPYIRGWIKPAEGDTEGTGSGARIVVGRIDWLSDINTSYDALPNWQRIWIVPAILIIVGAVNMKLTIARGYPFGLLFLIALLAIILVRAPYVAGLIAPPPATREAALVPHWVAQLNASYDAVPQARRFWALVAAILIIGAINLDLTLVHGTWFGLLYLIAFLAVVVLRAPYIAGWVGRPVTNAGSSQMLALEQPGHHVAVPDLALATQRHDVVGAAGSD